MRLYLNREEGFTLIESLLVLSIVTMLVSVSFVRLSPIKERQVMTHFIQQLTNDLLYAQQYAMSTKQTVRISFHVKDHYYRVYGSGTSTELIRRTYDPAISISTWTLGNTITFTQNGSISSSGTYGISYKGTEHYSIVFQLGFGRFYVQRL